MNEHDPRLDAGRAALIAQIDDGLTKIDRLIAELQKANEEIARLKAG